jgi:hypothetical protein
MHYGMPVLAPGRIDPNLMFMLLSPACSHQSEIFSLSAVPAIDTTLLELTANYRGTDF